MRKSFVGLPGVLLFVFCFVLSETGRLYGMYGVAGAGSLLSHESVLLQADAPWVVLSSENLSCHPECEGSLKWSDPFSI